MTRCSHCGVDVDLPFVCSYCDQTFCTEHRLPETHNCANLIFARQPKDVTVYRIPVETDSAQEPSAKRFTSSETGQIIVAWLVLGFCFSVGTLFNPSSFAKTFLISLFTLGLGFLGHELTHRNVARRFGCWAEFRLWPMGLVIAVMFALISGGRFIFAAPGAVYIQPRSPFWNYRLSKREYGLISLAGPLMNVVVGCFFLLVRPLGGIFLEIGSTGFYINLWLAAFNLIPFGMMDGQKVFSWDPKIWAAAAIPIWLALFAPALL